MRPSSKKCFPYRLTVALVALIAFCAEARAQIWRCSLLTADTTRYARISNTVPVDTANLNIEIHPAKPEYISPDATAGDRSYISFMQIFRPVDGDIRYTPSNPSRERLQEYQTIASRLSSGLAADSMLQAQTITEDELRYSNMIQHPQHVTHAWHDIAEPDKMFRERRKMKRTSDDTESLAELFNINAMANFDDRVRELPKKEPSPWTITGEENVQLSQLFLSNWVKGGESSTSLLSDLRFTTKYIKDKQAWESKLIHKLGVTKTSVLGTRLSDDVLDLSSKYGYKAVNKWYYSFLTTFKTQLFRSYDKNDTEKKQAKSTILSPAYVQFIVGMDYKHKDLSLLLSPFTSILTIVADTSTVDQTRYAIDEDKKMNSTNGFSITLNWKHKIRSNITYTTKNEIFYEFFKKNGHKRFDWENIIDMNINMFLTARFIFELRYFDNESDKFQVKENFSIAFKYSF